MSLQTTQITQAIIFATKVHHGQNRKQKKMPYVTHVMAVGLLLAQVTQDAEIITAGILHDTIEDCEPYGSVTYDTIDKAYGQRVATMVNDVTEPDKTLPWAERKQQALEHLSQMSHDSLLVKSADVLHNLTELVIDVEDKGVEVFAKFNVGQDQTLTRYQKLMNRFEELWPENPLLPELKHHISCY